MGDVEVWTVLVENDGGDTTLPEGRPERPQAPKTRSDAEAAIRHQDFETAHVFSDDGRYLFGRNGGASGIAFPDDEITVIRDAVFLHNHPNGGAFSNADLHFIEDINPAEFVAIGPTDRYVLKRPTSGWPANLHMVWFEHVKTIAARLKKDVDRGKMSESQRSARTLREALRKTAVDLRLDLTEGEG